MTIVRPIQCFGCARLHRDGQEIALSGHPVVRVCDAYPSGIPQALHDGADHRRPVGGETGGLLYLQEETEDGQEAFRRWQHVYGQAGAR